MDIYIARSFTTNEYGFIRIDSEAVFTTFERASEALKTHVIISPSKRDYILYGTEIVMFHMVGSGAEFVQRWQFDCQGNLLEEDLSDNHLNEKNIQFTGMFKVGDIVRIRSAGTLEVKPFDSAWIGVVAGVPPTLEGHRKRGWRDEEYCPLYLVDYINNLGILDHTHECEARLERFEKSIPDELEFLNHLSAHYKGIRIIKKEVFNLLWHGKYYLRKKRQFSEDDLQEPLY